MRIYPNDCSLVLKGDKSPSGRALTLSQKVSELQINSVEWSLYQNLAKRDKVFRLIEKDILRVWVPDGIGDLHWIFLKLESLKAMCGASKLIVVKRDISRSQDCFGRKDRVLPFLEMNPVIDDVELTSAQPLIFKEGFLIEDMGFDYVLDPNPFLLTGSRIEKWIPKLEMDWDYLKSFPIFDDEKVTGPPVLYFGDRFAEVTWGGNWTDKHWAEVLDCVGGESGQTPLVVGLEADREKAASVERAGGSFVNLVGATSFEKCFQLVLSSKLVVGSISGITILSAAAGVPTIALWPDESSLQSLPREMMSSWIREGSVGETYFPFGYSSSPELIGETIRRLL